MVAAAAGHTSFIGIPGVRLRERCEDNAICDGQSWPVDAWVDCSSSNLRRLPCQGERSSPVLRTRRDDRLNFVSRNVVRSDCKMFYISDDLAFAEFHALLKLEVEATKLQQHIDSSYWESHNNFPAPNNLYLHTCTDLQRFSFALGLHPIGQELVDLIAFKSFVFFY